MLSMENGRMEINLIVRSLKDCFFLGFLNANVAPHLKARVANYGLMDQIAALHWVQQNIELFGGDPGNVTLLGHDTGAACIHFLMVSPTVMPGEFKCLGENSGRNMAKRERDGAVLHRSPHGSSGTLGEIAAGIVAWNPLLVRTRALQVAANQEHVCCLLSWTLAKPC